MKALCSLGGLLGALVLVLNTAYASVNLEALSSIESSGNPRAFNSRTNCFGLFQISIVCLQDYNSRNKTAYTTEDLFDPEVNRRIAAWYLDWLRHALPRFGVPADLKNILAAYNWGIGNVARWHKAGADPQLLPRETARYVQKYCALTGENLTGAVRLGFIPDYY